MFICRILPYIIDLGSANGTYLNNQRIEAQRYYELKVSFKLFVVLKPVLWILIRNRISIDSALLDSESGPALGIRIWVQERI